MLCQDFGKLLKMERIEVEKIKCKGLKMERIEDGKD